MSLLAPLGLALTALAVPLVVLYMLKSRRSGIEVSSIRLWEGEEEFVSSSLPWKRLEITAALLLQLLALALFALALARPFFHQATLLGPHTVLVVDTSGSMAQAGRIDAARQRLVELAAEASEDKLISIVQAGPQPRVLAAFSREAATLVDIVSAVDAGGGTADLEGAIRLARGLATPDRPTTMLILSDGGVEGTLTEPVVDARHLAFDAVDDNLAITGFGTGTVGEGTTRAFVEVTSYAGGPVTVPVAITVDGLDAGTVDIELAAGGRDRRLVPVDAGPGQVVEASLVAAPDGNPLDDTAALVLGGATELVVATTGEGSPFLDALLAATPGVVPPLGAPADIVVMDGGDASIVDRPAWVIRPETAPPGIDIVGRLDNPVITFTQPGEPLLDGLDLSAVAIAEADIVQAEGWVPIVAAGDVPLILLGDVAGHRVVYFAFDPVRSNLPVQVAFPVLGARLIDWLAGSRIGAEAIADAGVPIAVAPPAGATTVITTPSGETVTVADQVLEYARTEQPGIYRVSYLDAAGEPLGGVLATRRFVAAEAAATPRSIAVTEPEQQGLQDATIIREWAPLLLALLLALVLVEWWVAFGRPRPRRRAAVT
ncbi:MAG: BatA domain-containing protein [Acidimicrobiia bacterium]|nr:BatA domain-containing protein [Acidimicrobiia bacterium]